MYILAIANEPKIGIKLVLISYLLPESFVLTIVPGSYSLFPYFCCCIVNPSNPYSTINF